ncbi:MAG: hypothetical protein JO225_11630, partial [Candidatus Eremiobacteraeota bacterium]|nr:hypothetical protein [Candidatus Eremiobacteraeota bacterium]
MIANGTGWTWGWVAAGTVAGDCAPASATVVVEVASRLWEPSLRASSAANAWTNAATVAVAEVPVDAVVVPAVDPFALEAGSGFWVRAGGGVPSVVVRFVAPVLIGSAAGAVRAVSARVARVRMRPSGVSPPVAMASRVAGSATARPSLAAAGATGTGAAATGAAGEAEADVRSVSSVARFVAVSAVAGAVALAAVEGGVCFVGAEGVAADGTAVRSVTVGALVAEAAEAPVVPGSVVVVGVDAAAGDAGAASAVSASRRMRSVWGAGFAFAESASKLVPAIVRIGCPGSPFVTLVASSAICRNLVARVDALSALLPGGPAPEGWSAWVNAWVSCCFAVSAGMPSCAATEVASEPASCVITSFSEV